MNKGYLGYNHNFNKKRQLTDQVKSDFEIIWKDFKRSIMKLLQWSVANSFETNEKFENLSKDIKII
jgi:LAS superfamily LD-carboxypeptidase LdcB